MSIFGAGHEVVTSTTRPATPTIGQIIFETDTLSYRWYNGTAWEGVTPIGTIQPFAGAAAPSGWLFCNGTILNSVTNTQYAALFVAIGTTYGGSGASSFNVPNMAGRVPVGAGTQAQNGASGSGVISGGTTIARTRGDWFGDVYLQAHTHTGSTGNPNSGGISAVPATVGGTFAMLCSYGSTGPPPYDTPLVNHTHNFTTNTHNQTAGAQQNVQPSVVTNYIIKI